LLSVVNDVSNDVSGSLGAKFPYFCDEFRDVFNDKLNYSYNRNVQSPMAHQFAGERSHAHKLIRIGRHVSSRDKGLLFLNQSSYSSQTWLHGR